MMQSRSFVIRRLGIASLARWGLVAGALVACLPSLVCSAIFFGLTAALRRVLDAWRAVGFNVLTQRVSLNLIELLQLQGLYDAVGNLTALGVFGILLLAVLFVVVLGAFAALTFALLGLFYNTTGRVEIELVERSTRTAVSLFPPSRAKS